MKPHPIRYLVLWLTTSCNLQCVYCYRSEDSEAVLELEAAYAALAVAGGSGLRFHVQLAGGEPTLEPDLVAAIAKRLRQSEWCASLALQTNGTLIDKRIIDLCKRYDIRVGLSIDGPPKVQEEVRGNAAGTFRGLRLLAEAGIPVRVTTVLSTANVMFLGDLVLALGSFPNVMGIGLDPLVRKGRAAGGAISQPSRTLIREGILRMAVNLKRVNSMRIKAIRWRELDAVQGMLGTDFEPCNYCHACRGESLAVHPDGEVYPCSQTVGDRVMSVGTVTQIDWSKLKSVFQHVKMQGECQSCILKGRCSGDCPSRLLYNNNSAPSNPRSVASHSSNAADKEVAMCLIYRTIAEEIITCSGAKNAHGFSTK